jgi:hypothetical protein
VDSEQIEIKIFQITDYSITRNTAADSTLIRPCRPKGTLILVPWEAEVAKILIQAVSQTKVTYSQIHTTMVKDKATLPNSNITSNKITQC